MTRSTDEPFTLYGLIARSIETDDARDRVVFHLDPRAHFSDGGAITAADVIFTFQLLEVKGRPQQRAARGVIVKHCYGRCHFVDRVQRLSTRVERQMPWTGTGGDGSASILRKRSRPRAVIA